MVTHDFKRNEFSDNQIKRQIEVCSQLNCCHFGSFVDLLKYTFLHFSPDSTPKNDGNGEKM